MNRSNWRKYKTVKMKCKKCKKNYYVEPENFYRVLCKECYKDYWYGPYKKFPLAEYVKDPVKCYNEYWKSPAPTETDEDRDRWYGVRYDWVDVHD